MRLIIDTLIALMLVGLLGSILWKQRDEQRLLDHVQSVHSAMRAIEAQAVYRAAIGDVPVTKLGYAATIDEHWFDPPPRNLLAPDKTPWIEIANDEEAERFNPVRITIGEGRAAFWYSPHRGIVRARVPQQVSEQDTIDLYNLVNGTSLRVDEVAWVTMPPLESQAEAR